MSGLDVTLPEVLCGNSSVFGGSVQPVQSGSNDFLNKGQRVTLQFQASEGNWRRALQIYIIEGRLGSHKDFEIIRANYWGEHWVSFEVEVKDTQALLTEKKIINYLIAANPAGFTLIFKENVAAAVEVVKGAAKAVADVTVDVFKYAALIALAVLIFYPKK